MNYSIHPKVRSSILIGFIILSSIKIYGQGSQEIEVIFIEPATTMAAVGQYEKLELGIQLPDKINEWVNEFLNNSHATYLNPYDPDHINVEAIFFNKKDTFKTYGFYYKDYKRDMRSNNSWNEVYSAYNWRIRFAPPNTGEWLCNIEISFPNSKLTTLYKHHISFTCYEKEKTGFIMVADDKRHFKFAGTQESFFVIGQNIAWTDEPIFKGSWVDVNSKNYTFKNKAFAQRLYHAGFIDLNDFVKNVGDNKGNMVRILSWHDSYLFEWEERGVYGSNRTNNDQNFLRQKRAWELDQLFETAETNEVKLLFCMEFQGQYCYDWNNGDSHSFYFNPYNKVEKDGKTDTKLPTEFFEDATLIQAYKKKLRYFIARWGYSPSLGILQLLNEFDGWSIDSTHVNNKINSILKKDAALQTNVRNWHDEIGQYIHATAHRPVIVTSGFMGNTKPTDIPLNRNLYNTKGIDLVIWNYYGNDRSVNYTMHQATQGFLKIFDKPFLYTETGLITNPEKNADPSDLEGCDDVMFHNFLWAGSVMGSAGTSLEWWQNFDNKRRENFKALNTFYSTIHFSSNDSSSRYITPYLSSGHLTETDHWNDRGTALYLCGNVKKLLKKTSMIEVYYVRTNKKNKTELQQAYGWAHNLTYYWANLPSYMNCPDRNNHLAIHKNCSDDEYTTPVVLNTSYKIQLKGLKPKKSYTLEWYSTRGEGGVVSTFRGKTNIAGILKLSWPGTDFDYAFKLKEDFDLTPYILK